MSHHGVAHLQLPTNVQSLRYSPDRILYVKVTTARSKVKLEYCFRREKEIVFAQQKQSVPMSINEFVEMTIFLCLMFFHL